MFEKITSFENSFGLLELFDAMAHSKSNILLRIVEMANSGFLERFYLKSDVEKELKMVKKEGKSKQKDPRMGKHTNKYPSSIARMDQLIIKKLAKEMEIIITYLFTIMSS